MKNLLKGTVTLIIILLSLCVFLASAAAASASTKPDFRGLWVATVVNIDYPSKPTTDSEKLKSEALKILNKAQATGLNAIFLQVRPTSDAFYKSTYFPWSKYLTGKQGLPPNDDFDPLAFWITEAHMRGMQLHAWINPYRITKKTSNEPSYDFASLDPSSPARKHQNWVVKYSDGNLYFNPGIPEVRKLIIDSILEIVQNYDVDGIHFDDYFYPGKDFNDKATYKKYGVVYKNINEWRRANVTKLIGDLSKAIQASSQDVSFGISPFGIWANKSSNSLGSETSGTQSYYDHYANTRKWVKDGLLDYIAPQIYWNIGYSIADYSKLLSWWQNTVSGTGVDLYIGQASYRVANPDPASPWYGISEIEKQLKLNEKAPGVDGSIFYNYSSIADNPSLSTMIKAIYEQRDGIKTIIPVDMSRPSGNISTSFDKFYLNGVSDPAKPLLLNGKPVAGRSSLGYFGILVNLSKGENIFTLSQEGSYKTRVIYRKSVSSEPQRMSTATISAASVYPQMTRYFSSWEKITLSCVAPIGSKVTVKLNGKKYNMKPSTTSSPGSGIYPTTFSYVYTPPNYKGTPRIVDLGAPAYAMSYSGISKTVTAPARLGIIMNGTPYYAKVSSDVIDTYQTPTTENGSAYELYKGMVDYITGMAGSYVRLSSGQWAQNTSVQIYRSKTKLNPKITKSTYASGNKWDTIKFYFSSSPAAISSFDGRLLKVDISAAVSAPLPVLPSNSPFSSVSATKSDGRAQYSLVLKDDQSIDGYYIEKTAAGITLHIKKHIKVLSSDKPLSGLTIMIDPGHGGSDPGAIGPLGLSYPEKTINLKSAMKLKTELEKLGATVLMTRTTDKTLSLGDRLSASRKSRPDMFISIHSNSMEDNVDISQKEGFSVFYREKLAQPLSETILYDVTSELNRNNAGLQERNFYVTRGTWTPSILIESGFVPNPVEFQWLSDDTQQTLLAKSISASVANYFKS